MINVPTYLTGQTDIQTLISGVVVPTTFESYINACFSIYTVNGNSLYIEDKTIYDEVAVLNMSNLTITYSYYGVIGDITIGVCGSGVFTPNTTVRIEDLLDYDKYRVEILINYDDGSNVYTKLITKTISYNHTYNAVISLKKEINQRISHVATKILSYQCIGRNVSELQERMALLMNIKWALCCSQKINKEDFEIYKAAIFKMKNC